METIDEILKQLATLYPMPSEDLLTPEQGFAYVQIIEKLRAIKDIRCIEMVACSFGYGDPGGGYWGTMHLLESFPAENVLPILRKNLTHPLPGVRQWSASMVGRYRDKESTHLLLNLLQDEYEWVRMFAVLALGKLLTPEICQNLQQLAQTEKSSEVQATLKSVLKKCSSL